MCCLQIHTILCRYKVHAACDCEADQQTANHTITECPPIPSTKWSPWLDWCWCRCSNSWVATKQVPRDLTVSFGYKVSHARTRRYVHRIYHWKYQRTAATTFKGGWSNYNTGNTCEQLLTPLIKQFLWGQTKHTYNSDFVIIVPNPGTLSQDRKKNVDKI